MPYAPIYAAGCSYLGRRLGRMRATLEQISSGASIKHQATLARTPSLVWAWSPPPPCPCHHCRDLLAPRGIAVFGRSWCMSVAAAPAATVGATVIIMTCNASDPLQHIVYSYSATALVHAPSGLCLSAQTPASTSQTRSKSPSLTRSQSRSRSRTQSWTPSPTQAVTPYAVRASTGRAVAQQTTSKRRGE